MNRQFDELYEKKPEENKEVVFDEEERVEDEDEDGGDSLFGEEEEIVSQKKYSITQLSDDEMEIEEGEEKKESEGKIANQPQPQKSSLLKMNKEGRLVKEKPQVSVMDMFKKAKQRQQEQESSESEIEPEIIEPEEEQQQQDQQEPTNTQPTTEEKEMVEDENTYEGDIQPTAEDYERYKQMMSENGMLSFN